MRHRKIIVRRYRDADALRRGLHEMQAKGYDVDQQATQRARSSLTAGWLLGRRVETVAFRTR